MYAIVNTFAKELLSLVSFLGARVEGLRRELVATWSAWAPVRERAATFAIESIERVQALFERLFTLLVPEGASPELASGPHHIAGIITLAILVAWALLVMRIAVILFVVAPSDVSARAVRRRQQELRHRAQDHAQARDEVSLGEDAPLLSTEQFSHIRSHGWRVVRLDRIEGVLRARDGRPTSAALLWDRFQRRFSVSLETSVLSSWLAHSPFRVCFSRGRLNYHLRDLPVAAHRDPGSLIESLQVFAAREEQRARRAS